MHSRLRSGHTARQSAAAAAEKLAEALTCSLSMEEFSDPVLAEDGHTYERSFITRWLQEDGTSP